MGPSSPWEGHGLPAGLMLDGCPSRLATPRVDPIEVARQPTRKCPETKQKHKDLCPRRKANTAKPVITNSACHLRTAHPEVSFTPGVGRLLRFDLKHLPPWFRFVSLHSQRLAGRFVFVLFTSKMTPHFVFLFRFSFRNRTGSFTFRFPPVSSDTLVPGGGAVVGPGPSGESSGPVDGAASIL